MNHATDWLRNTTVMLLLLDTCLLLFSQIQLCNISSTSLTHFISLISNVLGSQLTIQFVTYGYMQLDDCQKINWDLFKKFEKLQIFPPILPQKMLILGNWIKISWSEKNHFSWSEIMVSVEKLIMITASIYLPLI